jgi:hypothetical protein
MNSLAEKEVFRFAKMRADGETDERGPHGENLFSFQIAAPKFRGGGFVQLPVDPENRYINPVRG